MTQERRSADEFAATLQSIFGDALIAVLLYGSAARGDFRPGVSDLNLLVILRHFGLAEIRRAATITRGWVGAGNPPPLMLSETEWRRSADVFPLEYSDIREAHIVLQGEAPFSGVRIGREHLRLQLERELRSKMIQLREAYLVAGEVPEEMGALLVHSISTFLALFRGCLRLTGQAVPPDGTSLVNTAATLIGFDPDPVHRVMAAKHGAGSLDAPLDGELSGGYLQAVEKSVVWLDSRPDDATLGDV
jgi:hypothetical protein